MHPIEPSYDVVITGAGLAGLNEGQRVSYELVPGRGGKKSAENLTVTD